MKNLVYLVVSFLFIGTTTFATTHSTNTASLFARGYGNSFIFVEQGVEFAVFPDGQFDFNVDRYGPNFSAYRNFNGISISFNTGYSYDAFVQYDDFGAVIQIENVPVYYDYYGRIIQAGNVHIRYNNRGFVSRVGGMIVHYNRYHRFSHYTGFINIYNRHYVYRPWHAYYAIPRVDFCVIYNRPYRRYYTPVRYTYYSPYRNNNRPRVSYNYSRRGSNTNVIRSRSERYRPTRSNRNAIAQNSNTTRQSATRVRNTNGERVNSRSTNTTPRSTTPRVRENTPRTNTRASQSQPKPRIKTNTRVKSSTPTPRTTTRTRGTTRDTRSTQLRTQPKLTRNKARINKSSQRSTSKASSNRSKRSRIR